MLKTQAGKLSVVQMSVYLPFARFNAKHAQDQDMSACASSHEAVQLVSASSDVQAATATEVWTKFLTVEANSSSTITSLKWKPETAGWNALVTNATAPVQVTTSEGPTLGV